MTQVRLITLDPAHFHAALVQKEMYPEVDRRVHVYAPLTTDLTAHLNRIVGFNARGERPTAWELEVHAAADFLPRLLADRPGNVVVLSGRNRAKIDYILQSVQAGLNVLADKPWVLTPADLPKLRQALDLAEQKGLVAYDIMTERFEITTLLQREVLGDPDAFGAVVPGSPDEPAVYMESVHYLLKTVAGVPLRRPAWYFDVHQQGEGLSDVGTHLVDLVPWMLFPGEAIDADRDVRVLSARRWPTGMSKADYQKVTGEMDFPAYLAGDLKAGALEYYCNTAVTYTVRGVHVKMDVLWDLEAEPGAADKHLAVVQGTRAACEIRQGKEENYRPEVYLLPRPEHAAAVDDAVHRLVGRLQVKYPGVTGVKNGARWHFVIPDKYRVGHEAHFAEVTHQFLRYLQDPAKVPAWEKANMLAKYAVTTGGVELARRG